MKLDPGEIDESLRICSERNFTYCGSGPSSFENVPVGPSGPRSARRTGLTCGLLDRACPFEVIKVRRGEASTGGVDLDAGRLEVGGEGDRDRG